MKKYTQAFISFPMIFLLAIITYFIGLYFWSFFSTIHSVPDYGDLNRWIYYFLIPLAENRFPNLLTALFPENESLGHSHILGKLVILLIYKYLHFDFNYLRIIGAISYILLLVLLVYSAATEMKEVGRKINWLIIAACFVSMIHADETNTLTNNLLVFEYTYFLFSWLLIFFTIYAIKKNLSIIVIFFASAINILFSDIPGVIAIAVSFVLVIQAFYSKEIPLSKILYLSVALLVFPLFFTIFGVLFSSSTAASSISLDIERLIKWIFAGTGSGFLSESFLRQLGISNKAIYIFLMGIGFLIFTITLLAIFDAVKNRRKTTLSIAMILYSMIALLGTYLTRNSISDIYVLSDRYVRYFGFMTTGVLWYWFISKRYSFIESEDIQSEEKYFKKSINNKFILYFFISLFFIKSLNYIARIEPTSIYYSKLETAYLAYPDGEKMIVHRIMPLIFQVQGKSREIEIITSFYRQCRNIPRCASTGS